MNLANLQLQSKNAMLYWTFLKRETGRFANTISVFLRVSNDNSCKVEITVKKVNLRDGEIL